jgi:hypothetical protein
MTTGQELHDRLMLSPIQTADTLKALRAAIGESWPTYKLEETATMATAFSSTVFEYSLSTVTLLHRDQGPGEIYVSYSTSEPLIRVRPWWAWYDQSSAAWTVRFPSDVVSTYDGKTWYVHYQYKHPDITALSDTVYLPEDYALYFCQHWYGLKKISEANTDQRSQWVRYQETNYQLARQALLRNLTPTLKRDGAFLDRPG